MNALGRLATLLLLGLPLAGAGCRSASSSDGGIAPVPPAPTTATGGGLLQTGAIQLGPGVAQNWYRWMGDGEWGFQ